VFVATQAVGWSTFAATIVLIAVLLQQLVAGVALCLRCLAVATGTLMMVAQLVRHQAGQAHKHSRQQPAASTCGQPCSSEAAACSVHNDPSSL
jgi:hypothetical protein